MKKIMTFLSILFRLKDEASFLWHLKRITGSDYKKTLSPVRDLDSEDWYEFKMEGFCFKVAKGKDDYYFGPVNVDNLELLEKNNLVLLKLFLTKDMDEILNIVKHVVRKLKDEKTLGEKIKDHFKEVFTKEKTIDSAEIERMKAKREEFSHLGMRIYFVFTYLYLVVAMIVSFMTKPLLGVIPAALTGLFTYLFILTLKEDIYFISFKQNEGSVTDRVHYFSKNRWRWQFLITAFIVLFAILGAFALGHQVVGGLLSLLFFVTYGVLIIRAGIRDNKQNEELST